MMLLRALVLVLFAFPALAGDVHIPEIIEQSEGCTNFARQNAICVDTSINPSTKWEYDGISARMIVTGIVATPSIGQTFSAGQVITGATPTTPLIIQGSNPAHGSKEIYIDPTSGSVDMCKDGSETATTCQWRLRTNSNGTIIAGDSTVKWTYGHTTGNVTVAAGVTYPIGTTIHGQCNETATTPEFFVLRTTSGNCGTSEAINNETVWTAPSSGTVVAIAYDSTVAPAAGVTWTCGVNVDGASSGCSASCLAGACTTATTAACSATFTAGQALSLVHTDSSVTDTNSVMQCVVMIQLNPFQ